MYSLRNPYILFLEVTLQFKSQSYKLQKISGLLFILSNLLNPLSNQQFVYWKCIMHFTLGAYFNYTSDSIPYGPWLDCFHQQTDQGPYWVTLSGRLKTKIDMKQTADDTSGNCWHVARRPHDHCAIALGLPQADRPMSVRFCGPSKVIVGWSCRLLTTIARVYAHFWTKMTILNRTLSSRSPRGAPTGIVRRHCDVSTGYGLTRFSNLSLCGVKQNRRGHDARKSVRWSQGLPADAARKRWFGHRTGIVYSS